MDPSLHSMEQHLLALDSAQRLAAAEMLLRSLEDVVPGIPGLLVVLQATRQHALSVDPCKSTDHPDEVAGLKQTSIVVVERDGVQSSDMVKSLLDDICTPEQETRDSLAGPSSSPAAATGSPVDMTAVASLVAIQRTQPIPAHAAYDFVPSSTDTSKPTDQGSASEGNTAPDTASKERQDQEQHLVSPSSPKHPVASKRIHPGHRAADTHMDAAACQPAAQLPHSSTKPNIKHRLIVEKEAAAAPRQAACASKELQYGRRTLKRSKTTMTAMRSSATPRTAAEGSFGAINSRTVAAIGETQDVGAGSADHKPGTRNRCRSEPPTTAERALPRTRACTVTKPSKPWWVVQPPAANHWGGYTPALG